MPDEQLWKERCGVMWAKVQNQLHADTEQRMCNSHETGCVQCVQDNLHCDGEIHVTMKVGRPYSDWEIVQQVCAEMLLPLWSFTGWCRADKNLAVGNVPGSRLGQQRLTCRGGFGWRSGSTPAHLFQISFFCNKQSRPYFRLFFVALQSGRPGFLSPQGVHIS